MLVRLIYRLFALLYRLFERTPYEVRSFDLSMERIAYLERNYRTRLGRAGIMATEERRAMFWAQLAHESGLRPIAENLNYSASGLLTTFPKYFNPVTALQYARKPQAIANRVYANRMGNGDEASGDGWRFRGRGLIQTTGRYNYTKLATAIPGVLSDPDILLTDTNAMVAAIQFWTDKGLNVYADRGDLLTCTKIINGGTNGYTDRYVKYNLVLEQLHKSNNFTNQQ